MKTLTWTTEEEAKVLVGKKVRMSEQGIKKWGDQAEGGAGTIVNSPRFGGSWIHVEWDMGTKNDYLSGDLLLAEPEVLPLDKIAVRVETEEESRQVQERFFALGKKWTGESSPAYWNANYNLPTWFYLRDGKIIMGGLYSELGCTALSASAFLRDYPAPKPEPKPEPVKAETVPAWTNTSGGAFALKIVEPPPWTCPHCGGEYPGRVGKIRFDVHGRETTSCTPCFVALLEGAGWIKPPRRQTRLEALMEMGRRSYTSEIVHKNYPRGGDR